MEVPPLLYTPVYVINLDRRRDRWLGVAQMLRSRGFTDVTRVPAVDGRQLTPAFLERYVAPEALQALASPRINHEDLGSTGAVGCYLSHVDVWRRVARSHTPALVVEDDATVTPALLAFAIVQHTSHMLANVDVALLGYLTLRSHVQNADGVVPYVGKFFGTHFYYVTPEGARKLLQYALPITMQVDAYMGQCSDKLRMVVHQPNLSWQTGGDTDIQTPCVGCDRRAGDGMSPSAVKYTLLIVAVLAGVVAVRLAHKKSRH